MVKMWLNPKKTFQLQVHVGTKHAMEFEQQDDKYSSKQTINELNLFQNVITVNLISKFIFVWFNSNYTFWVWV